MKSMGWRSGSVWKSLRWSPRGVVSGREVEEYNACFFTRLKRVLAVVGEEGDLVHRRLPVQQLRIDRDHACLEEVLSRDVEK